VPGADRVPDLDELYDAHTLAALDRASAAADRHGRSAGSGSASASASAAGPTGTRAGNRIAASALVTGLALGLRDVFDPPKHDPVVIEVDADGQLDPDRPVDVVLVPGAPRASRATVRPWLLSS
jgi:hypothetical protein